MIYIFAWHPKLGCYIKLQEQALIIQEKICWTWFRWEIEKSTIHLVKLRWNMFQTQTRIYESKWTWIELE